MIYVTGDVHAMWEDWENWENTTPLKLTAEDTVIVCGDFGIGMRKDWQTADAAFFDHISRQPYTLLFLDGNHENFDVLNSLPETRRYGGRVHRIRPNLLHLMRGEVYDLEGSRVFVMGGGFSQDRFRRREGTGWWPAELPCHEEYENARANLERVGYAVDCILTHTAPFETVRMALAPRLHFSPTPEEEALTGFLGDVHALCSGYRHWYFGHFHADLELWRNQTALFGAVRELTTGAVRAVRPSALGE